MAFIITVLVFFLLLTANAQVVETVYIVQPGDTISEIASEHGLDWQYLADFNGIDNPLLMRSGMQLRIPTKKYIICFSSEERELLARLIHAEARGETLEGQIAVGAVVVNRVKSDLFPDSIKEVIYQTGQFTPVEKGGLPVIPQSSAVEAAERALAGEDPTQGALYFYNPDIAASPKFWESRPVSKQIGNHNFTL